MKKIVFFSFILILILSGCNNEHNPKDATVKQAKDFRDGTYVRITGEIFQIFSAESFRFKDSTGDITIEVDSDLWGRIGRSIPAADDLPLSAEIIGEVNKERGMDIIIDVEFLKML